MHFDIEKVDVRTVLENIFISNSLPFSSIFNGKDINRDILQGLFSIISVDAFNFADSKLKSIIKGGDISACEKLFDSELFLEAADAGDIDKLFLDRIQDNKHTRLECLNKISTYKETLPGEQLKEVETLIDTLTPNNDHYISNIVLSYLMAALTFQMGINDGRRQTKLIWLPSSSENADPFHALNYGKEMTLKSALKKGLGHSYGCKCGIQFNKLHDENVILLKQLSSVIKTSDESLSSQEKPETDKSGASKIFLGLLVVGLVLTAVIMAK